ncbi:unnamed protein product, partial [Prorocentrum cordatum]
WVLAARALIVGTTARRWWLASAALLSYIGDWGVLDSILSKPLVDPEDDASLRYTRESERLSFYDYLRVHMSSVTRWSRFYRTTGPQRGQVVLLVVRMYPKKKNDTIWIYVKPDRALGAGDVKDRAKMSSRRQPGWDYEAFPTLTASEKTDILEKAKEKQLEAELYLSNVRGY